MSAVAKPALYMATSRYDFADARPWADQGVTNAAPHSYCANERGFRLSGQALGLEGEPIPLSPVVKRKSTPRM